MAVFYAVVSHYHRILVLCIFNELLLDLSAHCSELVFLTVKRAVKVQWYGGNALSPLHAGEGSYRNALFIIISFAWLSVCWSSFVILI